VFHTSNYPGFFRLPFLRRPRNPWSRLELGLILGRAVEAIRLVLRQPHGLHTRFSSMCVIRFLLGLHRAQFIPPDRFGARMCGSQSLLPALPSILQRRDDSFLQPSLESLDNAVDAEQRSKPFFQLQTQAVNFVPDRPLVFLCRLPCARN